jgi:hypothetical protein
VRDGDCAFQLTSPLRCRNHPPDGGATGHKPASIRRQRLSALDRDLVPVSPIACIRSLARRALRHSTLAACDTSPRLPTPVRRAFLRVVAPGFGIGRSPAVLITAGRTPAYPRKSSPSPLPLTCTEAHVTEEAINVAAESTDEKATKRSNAFHGYVQLASPPYSTGN